MSLAPIKYPLDLTGKANTNLIVGETHDLSGLSQKAFVLDYGPFYTKGLVVRNAANNQVLQPKTQYVATQLFSYMTLETGLDICAVIIITDKTLPADLVVSVDYQVLGGDYSASVDSIQQLIDSLSLGSQPVLWADILGKPTAFPTAPHLHDIGDLYGFEYIVAALERLTQAIYVGDASQLQAIYQYIDHEIGVVDGEIAQNGANLTNHLADFNNPHRVTKTQVGLGLVSNFATATTADAQAGTASNLFMTPALVSAAIAAKVGDTLTNHINDTNNPHQVTKAQVGLGSVNNYGWATTADAQAGVATNGYMNPALTAAAISSQALAPLNAHTSNLNNPHSVTKAQVNLGSVNNYGTATNADAVTGTATNLYMTPASTAAAINAMAVSPLNAHIGRTDNPHAVTKTQVGLGSVDNTSDANKPISNATQAALDGKASIGAAVRFAGVFVGADSDIYIYESSTNAMTIRTGGAGAYKYTTFAANGDVSSSGKVIASQGFQPSDKRLKKAIAKAEPRALWRDIAFKGWRWKEDDRYEVGSIAQEVQAKAPDYVTTFDHHLLKGALAVDKAGMAYEMAMALGPMVDKLLALTAKQGEEIKALKKTVAKLAKGG